MRWPCVFSICHGALLIYVQANGPKLLLFFCSYGRVDELVFFAGLKKQYEIVVHHYIQVGVIIWGILSFPEGVVLLFLNVLDRFSALRRTTIDN
jgi:hypothetical protein